MPDYNIIKARLISMRDEDQQARQTNDYTLWNRFSEQHTTALKSIIDDIGGWPLIKDVSADAAQGAFLIVQHTHDRPLQKRCVALMGAAVEAGQAQPHYYALLVDRDLMHDGKPQLYGSQIIMVDGKPAPYPIENAEMADERRAAMGLGKLKDYVASFTPK